MARPNGGEPELVVLELPKEAGATSVAVAGDFNDWSVETHQMRQRDDGGFAITLELDPGRTYCYRYWIDGRRWENDWSADAYVPNEYGGDNSLLDLREGSPRRQRKTPVAHEPPPVEEGSPNGVPGPTAKAGKPAKAAKASAPAKTPAAAKAPRARKAASTTDAAAPPRQRAARGVPAEPTS